ncbi:hypothetical protein DICVIV_05237 [Dictyocaulus viviparus]|uniref:Uncharacterized protein n=1 Tax=Dictyocaulus viviparus TaxID=29172 RepID=A0A0D8XVP3_DICVI|nr:hypothetical protein DICVIV_05237 [Dictyocaulus viviparus]
MVPGTRNTRNLRRSFRTRPSNQLPVIHVRRIDVELFDDVSSSDDLFCKSPVLRRKAKKKKEHAKNFASSGFQAVECRMDDDASQIDEMIKEYKTAGDFSLYIENQDGVRMKAVGNKLVKYDEYYGKNSTDRVTPKNHPLEESIAISGEELQKLRRAAWSYANKISTKQKAVQPIEETTESESDEIFIHPRSNRQDIISSAGIPANLTSSNATLVKEMLLPFLEVQQKAVTPLSGYGRSRTPMSLHPFQHLSLSPFSTAQNIRKSNIANISIPNCLPQAQSTPFSEKHLQLQNNSIGEMPKSTSEESLLADWINNEKENVLQSQTSQELNMCPELDLAVAGNMPPVDEKLSNLSIKSSPRWSNVTERSKSRLLHMRSRSKIANAIDIFRAISLF